MAEPKIDALDEMRGAYAFCMLFIFGPTLAISALADLIVDPPQVLFATALAVVAFATGGLAAFFHGKARGSVFLRR